MSGGARRNRTDDLFNAIQGTMISQDVLSLLMSSRNPLCCQHFKRISNPHFIPPSLNVSRGFWNLGGT